MFFRKYAILPFVRLYYSLLYVIIFGMGLFVMTNKNEKESWSDDALFLRVNNPSNFGKT